MGTPEFAAVSLQALLQSKYEVVGVITQPDRPKGRGGRLVPPPVKVIATAAGVPLLQPRRVRAAAALAWLQAQRPDLVVTAAFGQILSAQVLAVPSIGSVNVHASLLPLYRGAAPIHRAIIDGAAETGITTMWMDEGMDTGDIILMRAIAIAADDTAGTLHDKLAALGALVLLETVDLIAAGRAPRTPQDHDRATYAPKLTREDERIDWSQPAKNVVNRIRGLDPWPGAYTTFPGGILKVWVAAADATPTDQAPGTVLGPPDAGGLPVAAGDGVVRLIEVQPQGRRRMAVADFLNGHPLPPGALLGQS